MLELRADFSTVKLKLKCRIITEFPPILHTNSKARDYKRQENGFAGILWIKQAVFGPMPG